MDDYRKADQEIKVKGKTLSETLYEASQENPNAKRKRTREGSEELAEILYGLADIMHKLSGGPK